MSVNPFQADPAVPVRLAACADPGELRQQAAARLVDGVLAAADAADLVSRFAVQGVDDLMLLVLPLAQSRARPPISGFYVGAVGLEAGGDLILGHNVEFPGTHLGFTLHGEGFVATRAFHRGQRLAAIALGEAHPCAHCRQFLSEFAGSGDLVLMDPLGHRLTLGQLYPWPFDPAYLGEAGAVAGRVFWPDLVAEGEVDPALLRAGQRAYAPYSRCPSAFRLALADGTALCGMTMESVAFNPSVGPLQAAVVEMLARGYDYDAITGATLAQAAGPVDFAASCGELLRRIAPGVALTVQEWRV